jgi:hypothetical protein
MEIEYDGTYETKGRKFPFYVRSFTPLQYTRLDVDDYISKRPEFTEDEWIDLLTQSIGFNPARFDRRIKLLMLLRLVPFVESNYNLIELGPRETGKCRIQRLTVRRRMKCIWARESPSRGSGSSQEDRAASPTAGEPQGYLYTLRGGSINLLLKRVGECQPNANPRLSVRRELALSTTNPATNRESLAGGILSQPHQVGQTSSGDHPRTKVRNVVTLSSEGCQRGDGAAPLGRAA